MAVVGVAVMLAAAGCRSVGPIDGPVDSGRPTATASIDPSSERQEQIFAEKRRITLAEAKRRLGWQAVAPDLAGRLESQPFFAGVWVDNRHGDRVEVGVAGPITSGTKAEINRDALAVGLTEGYDIVAVRFALSALNEANDWLGSQLVLVNAGAPGRLTAGLRTDLNAVELQTPTEAKLTPAQETLMTAAASRFGDLLVVSTYNGHFIPLNCSHSQCDPPLRGGARINYFNKGDFELCTGGFLAKGVTDDRRYLITAGHCVANHHDADWTAPYVNGSQHVVGPEWKYVYSEKGDYAILRITDVVAWNPQAWVALWYGQQGHEIAFNINSDNYSVLGMTVCHGGAESGSSSCGEVTELGVTATSDDGTTIKNLGRASYCATFGDSGAPVFFGHIAYGITSGGIPGTPCDTFYQGIKAVESDFNVVLLHSNDFPDGQ
ncbi:MAG TPA: S1 family peptidase [Actinoplanes sp.]